MELQGTAAGLIDIVEGERIFFIQYIFNKI